MGLITAEVQAGGGFVEIVRTPDRAVSVLVSSGMSLSIEVTRADDQPAAPSADLEKTPLEQSWFAWAERLADAAGKGGGLLIMAEDVPLMIPEEHDE